MPSMDTVLEDLVHGMELVQILFYSQDFPMSLCSQLQHCSQPSGRV